MFGMFRTDHPSKAWDLETHTKFYFFNNLDVPHQYTMPVKRFLDNSARSIYQATAQKVADSVESKPLLDKTWIKVLAIIGAGAFFPVLNMTGLLPIIAGYLLPPLAVLLVVYQFCAARQPRGRR